MLSHNILSQLMESGSGGPGQHAQQRVEQELEPGQPTRAMGHSMPGCPAVAMEQKLKPAKVRGCFRTCIRASRYLKHLHLQLKDPGQPGYLGAHAQLPVVLEHKVEQEAIAVGCHVLAAQQIRRIARVGRRSTWKYTASHLYGFRLHGFLDSYWFFGLLEKFSI